MADKVKAVSWVTNENTATTKLKSERFSLDELRVVLGLTDKEQTGV